MNPRGPSTIDVVPGPASGAHSRQRMAPVPAPGRQYLARVSCRGDHHRAGGGESVFRTDSSRVGCVPTLPSASGSNHGYHFFAPEPGDSTLLAYEAHRADGTVVSGRIPNRDIVPRLLYHRHFMLTEQMKDAPAELQNEWVGSYAEHLCQKLGAQRVS